MMVENSRLRFSVRALFAMKSAARASATTLSPSLSTTADQERYMPFRAVTGGFRQLQAAGGAQ